MYLLKALVILKAPKHQHPHACLSCLERVTGREEQNADEFYTVMLCTATQRDMIGYVSGWDA